MLKRHGTRLDIGTAEDVAELNAAEALLRASYKPTTMSTTGNSSSSAGGSGGGGQFGLYGGAPYSLPGAMTRSNAAASATTTAATAGQPAPPNTGNSMYYPGVSGGNGSGVAQVSGQGGSVHSSPMPGTTITTPSAYYAAGAAPPPHVYLGHPAGRSTPAHAPTTAVASATAAPTPVSTPASTTSIHAQRALYRSGAGMSDTTTASPTTGAAASMMSPAEGRPSGASTVTGYASSSSAAAGRTPAGPPRGGVASTAAMAAVGVRGTAQPLFHTPYSVEDDEVDEDAVGSRVSYGGEDDEDNEEAEAEDRGRPSMRRAPFAVPTGGMGRGSTGGPPRFPTTTAVSGMGQTPYARRGGPMPGAAPSAAPPRYGGVPTSMQGGPGRTVGLDGGNEEEEEEPPARPSRVSGRYQLPPSPGHGDPSAS